MDYDAFLHSFWNGCCSELYETMIVIAHFLDLVHWWPWCVFSIWCLSSCFLCWKLQWLLMYSWTTNGRRYVTIKTSHSWPNDSKVPALRMHVNELYVVFLMYVVAWHQDFPADPTGNFDEFKDFVKKNFEICKWIGLSVVCVQVSLSLSLSSRTCTKTYAESWELLDSLERWSGFLFNYLLNATN